MYVLKVPSDYLFNPTKEQSKVLDVLIEQVDNCFIRKTSSSIILPVEKYSDGVNKFSVESYNTKDSVVMLKVPAEFMVESASKEYKIIIETFKHELSLMKELENFTGGVILPSDSDSNGNPLFYIKTFKNY